MVLRPFLHTTIHPIRTIMTEEKSSCNHDCAHCSTKHDSCSNPSERELKFIAQMADIKHKIIVLSGKGGVGKSTVSVNIAFSLAMAGYRVGLMDVDFHGPSIPTMLGVKGMRAESDNNAILPLEVAGVKVISVDFFLADSGEAVIWRGPMKQGAIKQFFEDVAWGELDFLVIDCPPGTGDEPLGLCQIVKGDKRAVVVTTPQEVAAADVRKSLDFCAKLSLPVIGIIENMSGFACPHCATVTYIFKQGGGEKLAEQAKVPFLGRIPIDPTVADCSDEGQPLVYKYPDSPTAKAFAEAVRPIGKLLQEEA
mgnify:FL=1